MTSPANVLRCEGIPTPGPLKIDAEKRERGIHDEAWERSPQIALEADDRLIAANADAHLYGRRCAK